MQPDIPQDQLDRITPLVDDLRASLARLTSALPITAESALSFDAEVDPQ
jgi:hypothetical protein